MKPAIICSLPLAFLVPTLSLPAPDPQAVAPDPNNTFTIPGPLTVQVFLDGNAPGTSPPSLTHPAISNTLSSLVKVLSSSSSTSPLQRLEQEDVNGTVAGIRPEGANAGVEYGDAVHVMTALQGFLMGKDVDQEIDFVVERSVAEAKGQGEGVVANGYVRKVMPEGRVQ